MILHFCIFVVGCKEEDKRRKALKTAGSAVNDNAAVETAAGYESEDDLKAGQQDLEKQEQEFGGADEKALYDGPTAEADNEKVGAQ